MAKMGRPKSTPKVECPDHPGTLLVSIGVRTTKAGSRRRRYRCDPKKGRTHTFTVVETDESRRLVPITEQPPACPDHPSAKVVRAGTYGTKSGVRRQRYRCYGPNDGRTHVFTPVLPRAHVHRGEDACALCSELKGVHRGDKAFARRHRWPLPLVAQGLARLAAGESYAEVGQWAVRQAARRGRQIKPLRYPKSAWHIGADWTEAASPVLFRHLDTRLRAEALAERTRLDRMKATGLRLDRPQVLIVDDLPVAGRTGRSSRKRTQDGFYVLVAAELDWEGDQTTRLRLARALPTASAATWSLLFDELGYAPDFLVADGAAAITNAYKKLFASTTVLVPSLYHIGTAITAGLIKADKSLLDPDAPTARLISPLAGHIAEIRADSTVVSSAAGWTKWWDDFEVIAAHHKAPQKTVHALRNEHEPRLSGVFSVFADYPDIPASTGAVESIIRRHIAPMLARRRSGFRNVERTNRLFDLVVCRAHGLLDDPDTAVGILEADARDHDGYTTVLRSIDDPQTGPSGTKRYSSLRDPFGIEAVARERGVL